MLLPSPILPPNQPTSGILVIVADMAKRDVDLMAKVVLRPVLRLPPPQM